MGIGHVRIRFVGALVFGASMLFLVASPLIAAQQEIASDQGPLTRIIVSDTLSCQVAHREDNQFEFYPSGSEQGDCGTFLALGGSVYGPDTGAATQISWTPVSQAPVAGNGSAGDPLRVVTVVQIPAAALEVRETDSYVVGSQSYRTDVEIANVGNAGQTGVLYRAGDCYLQGNDEGLVRVDAGAPACIVDPSLGRRIEQWLPITAGSHFFAGGYSEVWSRIGLQDNFPDSCECAAEDVFDNGAGLSWSLSVVPGQSVTFSHETFFSPQGRGPVQEPFKDSIPDPTQISLDPIVVAQSVAITAGVIVLVPFPSALFNSTLEENYDEVMAGVHRVRAWLARQFAALRAWIKRKRDERRPTAVPAAAPTAAPSAAPVPVNEPVLAQPLTTELHGDGTAQADVWRTPLGMLGFVALSALLYCFLDPTFGLNLNSLATFAGMALGLLIVVLAYGLPLVFFSRSHKLSISIRALPVTLLIGVACVLVSRLANFQPGYLYGLVIGFFFAHSVTRQQEGPAEATAAAGSLLVAFVAWVGLAFLRGQPGADDFVIAMLQAASVTIVVAGLENAVFAMLPLRFLPGAAVFDWNRKVWIVLIALGLFGFAHVLLNPSAGYLADTTRTSFFTLILLLIGFGLASVLFWAYFRFRPNGHPTATSTPRAP